MSDLRGSLDQAMRAVVVGEPPVDAAMRRGAAIRRRRRVTAIAGALAVAVAVAVGYPALAHRQALQAPPPVTRQHGVVTVLPPGRGAAPGLVASGAIGNESWQLIVDQPEQLGVAGSQQCFYARGSAFGSGRTASAASTALNCGPVLAPPGDPVDFSGTGDGANQAELGAVATNVAYIVITLGDGQRLKLVPVRVYGTRLVAFAAPLSEEVASATAYLTNGQRLTAIPANLPGMLPVFGRWLRPGEPVPPRATGVISGTTGGRSWSVTVYEGPWGTCFAGYSGGTSACSSSMPVTTTGITGYTGSPAQLVFGTAAPAVSRLVVTLTGGHSFRAPIVRVGDEKLFAFELGQGQTLRQWTAYDAAGKQLSSGGL